MASYQKPKGTLDFYGIEALKIHYVQNETGTYGIKHTSCDLENVQRRDAIKTKYCEENNIKLLRLPYFEFNNFKDILDKEILSLYANTEVNQEIKAS